jgi:ketosteroid isomerase-like protein
MTPPRAQSGERQLTERRDDLQMTRLNQVREMFEAFLSSGDVTPLLGRVAEHAVIRLTVQPGTPLSGDFRGKEGIKEYFQRTSEVVRNDRMEVLDYLAGGDQVAVVGRETYTVLRSSQVQKDADWVTIFTFDQDLITSIVVIEDTAPIAAAYPAMSTDG